MDKQKKYIDAEKLLSEIDKRIGYGNVYYYHGLMGAEDDVRMMMSDSADVQPVKRGRWIERNPQKSDKCRLIECDQCGNGFIVGFNVSYEDWTQSDNRSYCGKCGACMTVDEV